MEKLNQEDVLLALQQHMYGDWGEAPKQDALENDLSVLEGFRILSA